MRLIYSAAFCFSVYTQLAYSWGSIQSQKVDGFSRYCFYSDGGALTVSSTDLCPINNHDDSNRGGSPTINIENRNGGFGTLKEQSVKGFNRYCKYSNSSILTVKSSSLCPSTSK